jgi:hypothetical protein
MINLSNFRERIAVLAKANAQEKHALKQDLFNLKTEAKDGFEGRQNEFSKETSWPNWDTSWSNL